MSRHQLNRNFFVIKKFKSPETILSNTCTCNYNESCLHEARLNIKANGLWGSRFSRAFFDVKIFNPHAKTSRKLHKDAYKYHETLKNSKYQQRILNVEQSSFCPLIFGCTGGAAPTATRTMQRLAEKLSEKRQESYRESINYIKTKISFALLRSSILCIRGCRSLRKAQFIDNSISAIVEEGRLR